MRVLRVERLAEATSKRAITCLAPCSGDHWTVLGHGAGHLVCSVVDPDRSPSRRAPGLHARRFRSGASSGAVYFRLARKSSMVPSCIRTNSSGRLLFYRAG